MRIAFNGLNRMKYTYMLSQSVIVKRMAYRISFALQKPAKLFCKHKHSSDCGKRFIRLCINISGGFHLFYSEDLFFFVPLLPLSSFSICSTFSILHIKYYMLHICMLLCIILHTIHWYSHSPYWWSSGKISCSQHG